MNEFLARLGQIGSELAVERGRLTLFGVFQPEESLQKWDVVVSAPWVGADEVAALRLVADKLQARLTPGELMSVSMVVPLKPSHVFVQTVEALVQESVESDVLGPFTFNGTEFARAHILAVESETHGTPSAERELVHRLREVGQTIAVERGALTFLGLFQRQEGIANWDVVLAAPWIGKQQTEEIPCIVGKLQAVSHARPLASIGTIIPLEPTAPFVAAVQAKVGHVDRLKEVAGFSHDGMELKRGYILTSHPQLRPDQSAVS